MSDPLDGTGAKKIANCVRGAHTLCSCRFNTTQFGVFALIDDTSIRNQAPAPPIPPIPPSKSFHFDISHIPIMPNWTWYPGSEPLGSFGTPAQSAWSQIPDSVKVGMAITMSVSLVILSIWKYWHFTRFEQSVDPLTGEVVELGNKSKSYFEMAKEQMHAQLHPEDVILSAQEALRKQQEARDYAVKLSAIREERLALRNRSKPLVPAGPILVEEDRPRQFMLDMYKPCDKNRKYVKPGRNKSKNGAEDNV